ncbi:MAG: Smr/MutS family protein [Rickettsiales bacterium]|jgi:DNA-nicking Smr family endonuclease|nr:Smr/MutS family protein [Rickettsiales bacterium]
MKQLSDADLMEMIGDEYVPDNKRTVKQVRGELKLGRLIPQQPAPAPEHATIDLHQRTEEQAWNIITDLIFSGTRTVTVITGASGILKLKFEQWVTNSIISPHIHSWKPLNNGSFEIKIKKNVTEI